MTMHFLMSFFNCLPLRCLVFGSNAGRRDDEQDAIHQQGLSDGYRSESAPIAGSWTQAPCSPMRFPRGPRRFSTRKTRTFYMGGGRPSAYLSKRRAFECRASRLNGANRSAEGISSTSNNSRYQFHRSATKDYARYEHPVRTVALSLTDRDMDVIEALFHFRGARRGAKETKWSEFLRLMERLQFKESRGAGNSSRFSPLGPSEIFPVESLGEVITEHRPHNGRNTLSLREMRDIGCRMNHAFGWTADTFRNIWER
ncbi:hypothetical protein ANO14919_087970 [Xylariales sp. No.14919]|nr:hypothetical protein ANO14919_087970 [Xylariales sp. No.14919]